MMKQLKKMTVQFMAGVNITVAVLMLLVGYSDRIDPTEHPLLACAGMSFPFFIILNFLFLGFWTLFKWKKLWIPLAGFALGYIPINIYMPVRVMKEPPPNCLKVISFNVAGYGGGGPKKDQFGPIFEYLVEQQTDILCIEEENDTWRHADKRYAEKFEHNAEVHIGLKEAKYSNHVAVHTRFPVLHSECIDLPTDTKSNGAAAFSLDLGNDTLLLVVCHLENVHLSSNDRKQYQDMLKGSMESDTVRTQGLRMLGLLSGAFSMRAKQAKALHQYIEDHRKGHPVLICGDFNDTPISFTRRTLSQGLTDCFVESGCGLGLSYNQKGFNFRIDHIMCSDHFTPYHCQVDTKMALSDHYPLVCWLKMREKP